MPNITYTIRVRFGGKFVTKPEKGRKLVVYEGGCVYIKQNVTKDVTNILMVRDMAANAFLAAGMAVPSFIRVWFKNKGKTVNNEWRWLSNDDSVKNMLQTANSRGFVDCFVTDESGSKEQSQVGSCSWSNMQNQPNLVWPNHYRQKLRSQHTQDMPEFGPPIPITKGSPTECRKSPRVKSVPQTAKGKFISASQSPQGREKSGQGRVQSTRGRVQSPKGRVESPKGRVESSKGRGQSGKRKQPAREVKQSGNKKKLFKDSDSEEESSGFSDLHIGWNAGEEEVDLSEDEFFQSIGKETKSKIFSEVADSLKEKQVDEDINANADPSLEEESDCDEDDLKSLEGSDEEADNSPHFNPEVDFKKPIKLQLGLKFRSAEVLRKALRWHAIQERFDYYFRSAQLKQV